VQLCLLVAADVLSEIDTAVNAAVSWLDEHLPQKNTSYAPEFCYQSVYYYVLPIQDTHCSMLHEPQQKISIMSDNDIRSVREYPMFATAQLLRNWREQRPSEHSYFHSSVMGKIE
jgi:hypothetical protein